MTNRDPRAIQHEDALIKAFVLPARQERFLYLIADPKRRARFTAELPHFRWFDPAYARPISWKVDPSLSLWQRNQQGTQNILKLLQSKGAGPSCWVISPNSSNDARESDLYAALQNGSDCILSCIPGRLAYFQGEEEWLLLERPENQHRPTKNKTEAPVRRDK